MIGAEMNVSNDKHFGNGASYEEIPPKGIWSYLPVRRRIVHDAEGEDHLKVDFAIRDLVNFALTHKTSGKGPNWLKPIVAIVSLLVILGIAYYWFQLLQRAM